MTPPPADPEPVERMSDEPLVTDELLTELQETAIAVIAGDTSAALMAAGVLALVREIRRLQHVERLCASAKACRWGK